MIAAPFTFAADTRAVQLPADQFYWITLDYSSNRATVIPESVLADLIQDHVPCPASDLALIAAPLSDNTLLVCAAPLHSFDSIPATALYYGPAAYPQWLQDQYPDELPNLRTINFLTGRFTPPPLQRQRALRAYCTAGLLVTVAGLIALGLIRRTHRTDQHASSYRSEIATLTQQALGVDADPSQADTLLRDRLQRSETLRNSNNSRRIDASAVAANFLSRWPDDLAELPRVEILSTTQDQISLTVSTPGKPQDLLSRLTPPTGWKILEPRLSTRGSGTQIQLELRPQIGGGT